MKIIVNFLNKFWLIILAISCQAQLVLGNNDAFYTAGVVEYSRSADLYENLEQYLNIIRSSEALATDIIVFPENTLNTNAAASYVPNTEAEHLIAPCDHAGSTVYHEFLVQISCQARNVSKYIVINISEKEECGGEDPRPCAASGLNFFNTNVVFDRQGRVISRYRKVNLWGEDKNVTYIPQAAYFDTDFGVRFGHFICFDILFYYPAQHMVDELGIRDFLFPSMWFSQLPFLTAVQMQSAWSYENHVNFLAAGSSNPAVGSTGSGIYHGRQGALVYVMKTTAPENKLYVAQVPKFTAKSTMTNVDNLTRANAKQFQHAQQLSTASAAAAAALMQPANPQAIYIKTDSLEQYNTLLIDFSNPQNSFEQKLCARSSSHCCHFALTWQLLGAYNSSIHYSYRVGVFDDWRPEIADITNQLKNCALFACTSENIADCGKINWNSAAENRITFTSIQIQANFPHAQQNLLMPNTVCEDLLPVPLSYMQWTVDNKDTFKEAKLILHTPISNLLTFSIYGNYFDNIVQLSNDGCNRTVPCFYLILVFICHVFKY